MDSKLVTALEAIYAAAPEPSLWPQALQSIADVLDDAGAILIWRRDNGAFGTIVSNSLVDAQNTYEREGWSTRELRAIRTAERGYFFSGEPFTDRHVCSEDEIRTDPVYTQFCLRHGMGWFGAVAVSPDPRIGVALSIQRNARTRPPYSDDELELIGRIGRNIEKSLRLSIRLLDAELANVSLREALARVGIGVFALDALKRVVYVNPVGERLLGDGLTIERDRSLKPPSAEQPLVDQALDSAIRGEVAVLARDPKPILIRRHLSERPLALYVLPVSPTSAAAEFLTQTRAIVLVIDLAAGEPADPAIVRDVLGLTLGEARVAALVGAGLTPREAAVRLGITEETSRTALKRVFAKVGVSRQSELTTLLTRIALPQPG